MLSKHCVPTAHTMDLHACCFPSLAPRAEPLPLAPLRSTSLSRADQRRLEAAQGRLWCGGGCRTCRVWGDACGWQHERCLASRMPCTGPRCRYAFALLKLLSTCAAAVLIGATAAAMHAAINGLIGWRNAALQFFFRRSLVQVGMGRGRGVESGGQAATGRGGRARVPVRHACAVGD